MRARHETLNGQRKNWRILYQGFCQHITMHGDVFRACVVLTPVGRFLRWKMRIRDRMK